MMLYLKAEEAIERQQEEETVEVDHFAVDDSHYSLIDIISFSHEQ